MVYSKKFSPVSVFSVNIPSLIFIFYLLSLTLLSCDLFNSSDKEYLSNIDEEIAWANAERLTVQVAVPSGWGSSPQTARCYDAVRTNETPRKGYPFTVEFSPNSGYGFVEWLAFGSEYTLSAIAEMTPEAARANSLNKKGVTVSEPAPTVTGAIGSTVTVTVNVPITLVPFCDIRPRLDQRTYPPINPMQSAFPYDQPINLWFTLPIKQDSAAGNVRISAVHTSDENLLGKKRGELFGKDGNLTDYFKIEFPGENRIDLIPKNSTECPSTHLMLLAITVEVGPGIQSTNGHAMDAIEKISYQTDTSEAQKVYRPGAISASRTLGSGYFNDSTEWRNPSIDRRFNLISNTPNYNTVYIRFSVTPPEDAPSPTPNRITVVERLAYTLRGFSAGGSSLNQEYRTTDSEVSYNISTGEYMIRHSLRTTQSGIIQLVVLPWYNDATTPVAPLAPDKAVAMSQYVSVVMDVEAPDLPNHINMASLSGYATETGGVYYYGLGSVLTVTVGGLKDLVDNGGEGGIAASMAWSSPWTMDDTANLKWNVMIGDSTDGERVTTLLTPLDVYTGVTVNNTWTPSNITGLNIKSSYPVYLMFIDTMGNDSGWINTGIKVVYSSAPKSPVVNLTASCTGNQIKVEWDTPVGMLGAYVSVNGSETDVSGSGTGKSYTFSTPSFNAGGVRSGQAVSNVTKYKIEVIAHNTAGRAEPDELTELTIWNIPGMSVTATNKAIEVTSVSYAYDDTYKTIGLANVALGDPGKQYVLAHDLSIPPGWTPIGNNSGANAFQGKFYGNGHTITLTNGISAATEYIGLFGYIQDAEIRDLRIEYANCTISRGSVLYFGGVVGKADASTDNATAIRNTIVGWNTGTIDLINSSSSATNAGLITGCMDPTVLVENCYAGLNLKVTAANSGISAGGITGLITSNPVVAPANDMINGITMAGTINATPGSSSSSFIHLGGIAGDCQGRRTINDAEVTGTLEMTGNTSASTSIDYACGGIIGRMMDGKVSSCRFNGVINIPSSHNVSSPTYVGGVIGRITSGTAAKTLTSARSSGNITVAAAGSGEIKIGGVCGSSQGGSSTIVSFTNCESSGNTIAFNKTTGTEAQLNIGGFLGEATGFTELESSWSSSLVIVNYTTNVNNTTQNLIIGGFVGLLNVKTERCFSTSNIEVLIDTVWGGPDTARRHTFGGFAGHASGNFIIDQCYASGIITVTSEKNEVLPYYCGGFAGIGDGGVTFRDCYATGNLTLDRLSSAGGGASDGGGFIGTLGTGGNTVLRCFAAGKVTIMSQRTDGGSAGGLIGYVHAGNSISNSVAFGESVSIITGIGSGQFWGRVASNNGGLSNNYAVDTLRVWSLKGSGFPTDVTGTNSDGTPATPNPNSNVGETVIKVSISRTFWEALPTPGVMGVNFSNTVWNTGSPVTAKGYPTLKNVGGTQ